jgi:hypothetical protein
MKGLLPLSENSIPIDGGSLFFREEQAGHDGRLGILAAIPFISSVAACPVYMSGNPKLIQRACTGCSKERHNKNRIRVRAAPIPLP